ncbi:hypothetical protein ANO11243_076580 [Dothideomycetidae sp. 11243]|nr:hypothetical protein ANO11243_076580 [fungal sp. No.11243]
MSLPTEWQLVLKPPYLPRTRQTTIHSRSALFLSQGDDCRICQVSGVMSVLGNAQSNIKTAARALEPGMLAVFSIYPVSRPTLVRLMQSKNTSNARQAGRWKTGWGLSSAIGPTVEHFCERHRMSTGHPPVLRLRLHLLLESACSSPPYSRSHWPVGQIPLHLVPTICASATPHARAHTPPLSPPLHHHPPRLTLIRSILHFLHRMDLAHGFPTPALD